MRDKASEIAAIVSRLLSHYWTAAEHAAIRQAQLEDWLEDLVEFDIDIVRDACAEWRRKPVNRRPAPGEIRAMAFSMQAQRFDDKRRFIEDKNRAQDGGTWEPWLYELWGSASTGRIARQAAIDAQNARYARAEQWRRENPEHAKPLTARNLGVTSAPHVRQASYPDDPT